MATLAQSKPLAVEVSAGAAMLPEPPRDADPAAWAAHYERLYQSAGSPEALPWAEGRPCAALLSWLTVEAPCLVRPGASAVVVGCGVGDDAAELAARGYDVTAFDVSATAVEWARRRHPQIADRFVQADLLTLPASMQRRADLVVEIHTLQAMHPGLRARAAEAVASLARPRGTILVICRGRDDDEPLGEEPPFAFSTRELTELFSAAGWQPTRDIDDFVEEGTPSRRRLRAAFRRG